jgi:hypothetical protein
MNLIGLLAGNMMGGISSEITNGFIEKIIPNHNGQTKFLDAFRNSFQNTEQLTLADLNLGAKTEQQIMDIRDLAMNKGLESIEVEINGDLYQLNTRDLTLRPMYSSSI